MSFGTTRPRRKSLTVCGRCGGAGGGRDSVGDGVGRAGAAGPRSTRSVGWLLAGQASEKRRRLDELTNALQPGDRLVVSELSRLGRSLGQVVAVLDALAKAGVVFVALKENIRVEGKRDIQTKVMTTLFALFAEVERDLISERTREGLARAKSSGRKLGRPKGSLGVSRLDGKEDEIRRFLELGVSKTRHRQAHGRVPDRALQLHDHQRAQAESLACIRARMVSVPWGPKHVVTKGATPVLSPAEARRLLDAIDTGTLAGPARPGARLGDALQLRVGERGHRHAEAGTTSGRRAGGGSGCTRRAASVTTSRPTIGRLERIVI